MYLNSSGCISVVMITRLPGLGADGLLMLRLPVVVGAVRVEYEAKAAAQPGDLSLCLGMKDGDFAAAAFLGFGASGNTANLLRMPGMPPVPGTGPFAVTGQWHQVTARREGGRLTLQVDGAIVAAGDDSRAGYPGPYVGLYCRNEGVFRHVKVQRRACRAGGRKSVRRRRQVDLAMIALVRAVMLASTETGSTWTGWPARGGRK